MKTPNAALARLLTGLMIFGIIPKALAADAARPPLPTGPLVEKGGDFSAWQIDYTYESDKPAADGKPVPPPPKTLYGQFSLLPLRSVTFIRTAPYWHSLSIDIGGGKVEQWSDGITPFFQESDFPPTIVPGKPAYKFPNFNGIGFPEMNWISPSTYVGTESVEGRMCFVFAKDGAKAWIDLKKHFPVKWQQAKETRTFRQLPAPTEALVIPPEIQANFAAMKKR